MKYDTSAVNQEIAFVTQACLGAISANVVAIHLVPNEAELILKFDLEAESLADREEIQEIAEDFYAMHADDPVIRTEVLVVGSKFDRLAPPARSIYIRK
jgi:hypothetical protein